MKIGITGQKGFIGNSILKALLRENHQVISLDKYTRSSVIDEPIMEKFPNDLQWLLHFGANTSIKTSWEDPFFAYTNNINSTIQALKIAHNCKAAFLFMSSYVYGNPQYLPIDEKHPVMPLNPYMGSKIIGEEICRAISDLLQIPLIVLRAFNIYGKVQIPGRLISDLLNAVRQDNSIILNDTTPKRDYLYIKDFDALILKIISNSYQINVQCMIFILLYDFFNILLPELHHLDYCEVH